MAIAVVSSLAAHAQSCEPPFRDSTYRYIASYNVTQAFPEPLNSKPSKPSKKSKRRPRKSSGLGGDNTCAVGVQVCVWQKGMGKFQLVQDLNSLSVVSQSDSCTSLDSLSTSTLCSIMARDAILQGITLGILPCIPNCVTKDTVTVWQSSCVRKLGNGATTQLNSCVGAGYCSRDYTFCCAPAAQPIVVPTTPGAYPTCGGGCEATCQ